MNKPIRWGIWGTGVIAGKVASDFPLAKGSVLHAVASRSEERARSFALQYGAAKWYGSRESLLADAEVDAVYIATPNHCHAADSIATIEAGKAVLCEKPFALNFAQAQRVVAAARAHHVFCMEAMWTRFIPAVIEAKRAIEAGAIGPIRLIQGNFGFQEPKYSGSRLFNVEMGGGALLDIGVYLVSLAHHLLGTPQAVHGTTLLGATGVDEQSTYQLTYADGALADLWASLQVEGTNDVVILGERGMLHLCEPFYCAHRFILKTHGGPLDGEQDQTAQSPSALRKMLAELRKSLALKSLRRRLTPLLDVVKRGQVRSFPFAGNGYQFELNEVTRCLQAQRTESAVMPLNDTLEVMRTMDALRSQWGLVFPQER